MNYATCDSCNSILNFKNVGIDYEDNLYLCPDCLGVSDDFKIIRVIGYATFNYNYHIIMRKCDDNRLYVVQKFLIDGVKITPQPIEYMQLTDIVDGDFLSPVANNIYFNVNACFIVYIDDEQLYDKGNLIANPDNGIIKLFDEQDCYITEINTRDYDENN